jgi:hypothetical protein
LKGGAACSGRHQAAQLMYALADWTDSLLRRDCPGRGGQVDCTVHVMLGIGHREVQVDNSATFQVSRSLGLERPLKRLACADEIAHCQQGTALVVVNPQFAAAVSMPCL